MAHLLGGIEAGGTKFVCAVGDENGNIQKRVKFPTTTPEETMKEVFAFFDQYEVEAIGIGSFGPIDINPESPTYGYVTDTPKLPWKNYNFLGAMKARYDIAYEWTTDVNVAAYGEYKKGAGVGKDNVLYATVGTGIGVGYISHGELYRGRSHPEGGHILMQREAGDDFAGVCPYHGACLEGLAAGPAVERRAGKKGDQLLSTDSVWETEAFYLAQACMTYTLTFSPDVIIFGGGVMKQEQLFPMIREKFLELMHDYVRVPDLDNYIVHVELGDDAGITGSLLAAADVLGE